MSLRQELTLKYIRTKFKLLSSLSKRKAAEKAFTLFCTPQRRTYRKPTPLIKEAEKLTFSYKDFTIKGYRWNYPSDKKILILHGFESSIINFERYVTPLMDKGYEVLGFDAMAHGTSTGKMINVLLYKDLIQYVNQQYGPVNCFIAHSMGGLAVSLALEEIEHNENYKVVLIAPATETTTASDQLFQILKLDAAVRKEFDAIIMEQSGHPVSWFSAARAASNIKAQVLWAHDKQDAVTPYKDIEPIIKAAYHNYQFLITEGLGHSRIYRDAKVAKAITDFF